MTVVTRVHLLRHGEVHNPKKVLYGRLPGYGLSETGHAMADVAAKALAGRDVALLLTSPLQRARETAAPLEAAYGTTARADDRLIESASHFEGKPVDRGWKSFASWSNLRYLRNPFRPSWGEPYAQTARRMLDVVTDVRDEVAGHEAICVSHQLPIYVLRRYVEGRRLWHDPRNRQCGLASVTTLTWHGTRLASVTYTEPAGALARKDVPPGA